MMRRSRIFQRRFVQLDPLAFGGFVAAAATPIGETGDLDHAIADYKRPRFGFLPKLVGAHYNRGVGLPAERRPRARHRRLPRGRSDRLRWPPKSR